MNGNTAHRIRALLLQHPDGMTIDAISRQLGREYTNIAKRLHATYGCYVSRWSGRRQIWCCVPVPENAPRPAHQPAPVKAKAPKFVPKNPRITAAMRARMAKPITQKALAPASYKPQKTVWQPVAPWPKEAA